MPPSSALPHSPATDGLQIRPFRALTYRRRDPEHLARVSSPAYDLVTPQSREHLADADPHNIVRLILPHVDPAPGGPGRWAAPAPAEHSARTLHEWLAAGVLARDSAPGLWLYEMQPASGGPPTVGWLAAVRLPPPGSTAVLPHEDTYPPAVEGRRALLAATRTDLEPIVLAHDPDDTVAGLTAQVHRTEPTLALRDSDGVAHRLWLVTEIDLLDTLAAAFGRTAAVIADGHHRFAAAQAHHREVTATPGRAGGDDPGSDAVLALLTPMGEGGLRVEAIHRVVPALAFEDAESLAARGFTLRPLPGQGPQAVREQARRWLHEPGHDGFLISDGRRLTELTAPTPEIRATVPSEAPPAWRRLDVVLAHAGLLGHLWHRPDEPEAVLVAHDLDEAFGLADERSGVAVLLRAPSPADVAAVARAGARMPRKSTLFLPKPRTGLVLRPHGD